MVQCSIMSETPQNSPKLKRCPRCGGNLFMDKDHDGWYMECLQCSFTRELERIQTYRTRPWRPK